MTYCGRLSEKLQPCVILGFIFKTYYSSKIRNSICDFGDNIYYDPVKVPGELFLRPWLRNESASAAGASHCGGHAREESGPVCLLVACGLLSVLLSWDSFAPQTSRNFLPVLCQGHRPRDHCRGSRERLPGFPAGSLSFSHFSTCCFSYLEPPSPTLYLELGPFDISISYGLSWI